jgi:hypothetical protein
VSEIVDETMASAARVHAVEQGMTLEDRSLIALAVRRRSMPCVLPKSWASAG